MAPDRTSRDGGFSLPAKRNSALATAAMASAALLSQTGNAAADEVPSPDEVNRRITSLYNRAEDDSGTYNATRAAGTASSTRGRSGSSTGGGSRSDGGSRSGGDPSLDAIARQWYGSARAKMGPVIEASLPADRVANRRAEPSRQRPASATADAVRAREAKPAERSLPELAAKPVLALPGAPEPAQAALTAAPAQSPSWAPEPTPQDLTGTGGFPALGTSQPVTGVPEYTARTDTGSFEYRPQLATGAPEYTPPSGTTVPAYTPPTGTALPAYTAQTGQLGIEAPQYAPSATTGFPEYAAQTGTGLPEYAAQATTAFPEYAAQPPTGYSDHSALTAPLATLAPLSVDTAQAPQTPQAPQDFQALQAAPPLPVIPAPRSPEPSWQTAQQTPQSAPAPDLPTPDTGYDSKVIQVLAFARSQIGKPCVWGAAGPGSYDNSGLAQAAWKVAGVSLPRTALGQASAGTAVPLYAMQPGDLVFFHDDFSHVGLCTGNGMMIHAPGPGSVIREESIYPTGESIIRGAVRPA
ncbi:NlpC/P60 family protein [Streptomyces sp. WSLK1-5]|uniref:C40 family peptidase n=1 Tax=unclassified Streptomyces TaxID=2593676 RepID=UPI0037A35947